MEKVYRVMDEWHGKENRVWVYSNDKAFKNLDEFLEWVKQHGGTDEDLDPVMQVGDLITAYRKGYHEVVGLEPFVSYKQVFTSKYKYKPTKAIHECCSSYCHTITIEELEKIREEMVKDLDKVIEYLKEKA